MPQKESENVSEDNGPVHQEELGFVQPAPVYEYREIKNLFKRQ